MPPTQEDTVGSGPLEREGVPTVAACRAVPGGLGPGLQWSQDAAPDSKPGSHAPAPPVFKGLVPSLPPWPQALHLQNEH